MKLQNVIFTLSFELHQEETLPVSFLLVPLGWKTPWKTPDKEVPMSSGICVAATAGAAMITTKSTKIKKYKVQYFLTILFLNLACFNE